MATSKLRAVQTIVNNQNLSTRNSF